MNSSVYIAFGKKTPNHSKKSDWYSVGAVKVTGTLFSVIPRLAPFNFPKPRDVRVDIAGPEYVSCQHEEGSHMHKINF